MAISLSQISDKNFTESGEIIDLMHNGFFISINKTSGLPLFWSDSSLHNCVKIFVCGINTLSTLGWVENQSFQLATRNISNGTWSWIYSNVAEISPGEKYEILTHMMTNQWAKGLHVVLKGYNESSQEWYQIKQCPSGNKSALNWREFDCMITVPPDTSKIVLILMQVRHLKLIGKL
jgi:hypothetical protein